MAQAVARMGCADLDNIPVYNLKGEKKTIEKKLNAGAEQFLKNMGALIPEKFSDPEKNER